MSREPIVDIKHKFISAADKLSTVVGSTMGPAGKLIALQNGDGRGHFTKDGISVAKTIQLKDPIENMCAKAIIEASAISARVGDGTTSAVVLACGFLKTLLAHPEKTDQLKKAVEVSKTLLTQMSKPADTAMIRAVAQISSNGDQQIIDIVCRALEMVGADGLIRVEESYEPESKLFLAEGFEAKAGWVHKAFCNKGIQSVYSKPLVWSTMERLFTYHHLTALKPILEEAAAQKRPLVIIAPDFSGDVLKTLLLNHQNKIFECLPIKTGENFKLLEDLSAVCRVDLRDPNLISPLSNLKASEMGELETIEVSPTDLFCIAKYSTGIEKQVKYLKAQLEDSKREMEKTEIKQRIAALSNKTARIMVGGVSTSEIREQVDRFDDCVCAVLAAAKGGVVGGGGQSLRKIASIVQNPELTDVLNTISNLIQSNSGKSRVLDADHTWDARNDKIVDPFEALIVDPMLVVKTALEAAFSVAVLLANTAGAVVTQPE